MDYADHAISKCLIWYGDYIKDICSSHGISQNESIIIAMKKLKNDLEKAQASYAKIAKLQSALDKSKVETTLLRVEKDKLWLTWRPNEELEAKKYLKEKTEAMIDKWWPQYNTACSRMNRLFESCDEYLESYSSFSDAFHSFLVGFELTNVVDFDVEINAIDEGHEVGGPLVDKELLP